MRVYAHTRGRPYFVMPVWRGAIPLCAVCSGIVEDLTCCASKPQQVAFLRLFASLCGASSLLWYTVALVTVTLLTAILRGRLLLSNPACDEVIPRIRYSSKGLGTLRLDRRKRVTTGNQHSLHRIGQ